MDKPKNSKEKKEHTANFIVSRFFLSKYSRKKKYKLNLAKRGMIRYIADCIDLTFKKHKKFHAKLSQKQIATQNGVSLKTIWNLTKDLVSVNILKYDEKNQIYSFGRVLLAYVKITYPIEVRKNYVGLRSTSFLRTSNSSNITNNKPFKNSNEKPYAPAPTAVRASKLLEDFQLKIEKEKKC